MGRTAEVLGNKIVFQLHEGRAHTHRQHRTSGRNTSCTTARAQVTKSRGSGARSRMLCFHQVPRGEKSLSGSSNLQTVTWLRY